MFVQERAGNGQLLSAERRRAILDALERDGKVVAARLVEELGVSEDTVRRDLRELAAQGLVQRVHGGALPPAPQPGSFERRRETFGAEKAALAEAAVGLLAEADVVVIGGRLDKRAQVTTGAATVDFIRSVRADACVLGVCALHPEAGLSTDDLEEAYVKRAMVAASADVIALATADKLRAGSPYLVAPVAELTHVVAEAAAPDDLLEPYRALGVSVTRA